MQREPKAPSRLATFLLPCIVDIIFIRMFYNIARRGVASLDIWWHLKTGAMIFSTGVVPHHNMYSFTSPSHLWITHEWLSQVIFWMIYSNTGENGLLFVRALLFAWMVVIIYLSMVKQESCHFLTAVGIIALSSQLLAPAATLRPWLFSNFLAAILVYFLQKRERDMSVHLRHYLVFPLILWLWTNFHGSYVIGYVILFLALLKAWTSRETPTGTRKNYVIVFISSLILLLLNPNGFQLLTYPLKYRLGSLFFAYITEWQQPDFHSFFGIFLEVYMLLLLVSMIYSSVPRSVLDILKVLIFIHLALTAQRNSPYLVIVTAPLLSLHLSSVLHKIRRHFEPHSRSSSLSGSGILSKGSGIFYYIFLEADRLAVLDRNFQRHTYLVLFLIGSLLFFSLSPAEAPEVAINFYDSLETLFPVHAVEYMKSHEIKGNIFNYFNWGGYLIWYLYPQARVFIDGRADPYPAEVLTDYYSIHACRNWQRLLDKYDVNVVLYPAKEPLSSLLKLSPHWRLMYEDTLACLFVPTAEDEQK